MTKTIRRIVTLLLIFAMMVSSAVTAYAAALPQIHGLYDGDTDDLKRKYAEAYGWDEDNMEVRSWEVPITHDGVTETVEFRRSAGYQKQFLKDNGRTTRQYLGLSTASEYGYGSGAAIIEVAMAELGLPESYESPMGSNHVKYNDWFYGHSVSGDAYQWCCVFVSWCAAQCGYLQESNDDDDYLFPRETGPSARYNGAWCQSEYWFFEERGYDIYDIKATTPFGGTEYTPVPGDIMLFWDTATGKYGHIGFIAQVEEDGWYTVEGNCGNKVSQMFYSNTGGSGWGQVGSVVHIPYPEDSYDANVKVIYRFLTEQMSMTPAAACGAIGNMRLESGCIPDKTEYGYESSPGAGYGLIQWTNTVGNNRTEEDYEDLLIGPGDEYVPHSGMRRTNLINWCTSKNYNYRTLSGQLAFLKYEIENNAYYSNGVRAMNAMPNTVDGAMDAATKWMIVIEGCNNSTNASRRGYARTAYQTLVEQTEEE